MLPLSLGQTRGPKGQRVPDLAPRFGPGGSQNRKIPPNLAPTRICDSLSVLISSRLPHLPVRRFRRQANIKDLLLLLLWMLLFPPPLLAVMCYYATPAAALLLTATAAALLLTATAASRLLPQFQRARERTWSDPPQVNSAGPGTPSASRDNQPQLTRTRPRKCWRRTR